MKVLVTGGAGYIGSTICSALEDAGHVPVILDSLVTGRKEFTKGRIFYEADIADEAALKQIFSDHPDIQHVIHCAALILVPESVAKPYEYYISNVAKSTELFYNLHKLGCNRVVFSSSASIYDVVPGFMVTEESPLNPLSPYARTKYMMEMVLQDFCSAYGMKGIALRYFNPIGADPKMRSGMFIEEPSHILGRLVDAEMGKDVVFRITGTDYPTRDGTGIRDYLHVWDLALAHIAAVEQFDEAFTRFAEKTGSYQPYLVINLGSGNGVTVREFVTAFEKVIGKSINKVDAPRRPGDAAGAYASAARAYELLGWKAVLSIEQGIADALEWAKVKHEILES
ncbi:MAG: UDP-glucose 4-epimerase GalE [Bacillota bacterium]